MILRIAIMLLLLLASLALVFHRLLAAAVNVQNIL
jgi:hypothetical protein